MSSMGSAWDIASPGAMSTVSAAPAARNTENELCLLMASSHLPSWAISLIVLWSLLLEGLLGAFGSFGRTVKPFLPFQNANRFLTVEDVSGNWHWGVWGSLIYFAVFVAIVFAGALVVVNRRDA